MKVLGPLQDIGSLAESLGHDGVQGHIGLSDGVGGAHHAELKLVASEGEGGGAVPVGGILAEFGQDIHPKLHLGPGSSLIGGLMVNGLQHTVQLISQEDGYHSGRRLVGS